MPIGTLVIRTAADPAALVKAVEALVRGAERDAPIADVITMDQAIGEQFAEPRFYLAVLGAFAAVALILAAVGVYGVINHSVARRSREIGIRLALGAGRPNAFRMIMRQAMGLAVIGGAAGSVAAFLVSRFLVKLLYGVRPTDPVTFVVVPVVLLTTAFLAAALPGWRASRVDPAITLKSE